MRKFLRDGPGPVGWSTIIILFSGGVLLLAVLCLVGVPIILVGGFAYASTPQPAPQPYPGAVFTEEWTGGSCCSGRIREYTIAEPLAAVEQWYVQQMHQYCEPGWMFVWEGEERVADCSIPRIWYGQGFDVRLRKLSESQTAIWSEEMWGSP